MTEEQQNVNEEYKNSSKEKETENICTLQLQTPNEYGYLYKRFYLIEDLENGGYGIKKRENYKNKSEYCSMIGENEFTIYPKHDRDIERIYINQSSYEKGNKILLENEPIDFCTKEGSIKYRLKEIAKTFNNFEYGLFYDYMSGFSVYTDIVLNYINPEEDKIITKSNIIIKKVKCKKIKMILSYTEKKKLQLHFEITETGEGYVKDRLTRSIIKRIGPDLSKQEYDVTDYTKMTEHIIDDVMHRTIYESIIYGLVKRLTFFNEYLDNSESYISLSFKKPERYDDSYKEIGDIKTIVNIYHGNNINDRRPRIPGISYGPIYENSP